MTRKAALVTAGVIVLVSIGVLVGRSVRVVEEEVEIGSSGAARLNPLLAAERLYTRLGLPARTDPTGRELPGVDQLVLLLGPRRGMSDQRLYALLDWVARGGRLVAGPAEEPSGDRLFTFFGVETRNADRKGMEALAVRLDEGAPARLEIAGAPRLRDTRRAARTELTSQGGAFLLRFGHGKGEVTLLSDAGFLTNERIGTLQNARLAWWLAETSPGVKGVRLFFRDELPPFSLMVMRSAWMVLVSLAVYGLCWLLSHGGRFGPPLLDPPRGRRSLMEHVRASGEFLFRHGQQAALLEATRGALRRRLEVVQPSLLRLPVREQAERVAALARVPVADAESALTGATPPHAVTFVEWIRTLEVLRRSL